MVSYLGHVLDRAAFPVPATVALYVPTVDWLMTQVMDDFRADFPSSRIVCNPTKNDGWDIAVRVTGQGEGLIADAAWAGRRLAAGAGAIGLYAVDDRHLELVRRSEYLRWWLRRCLLPPAVRLRLRHPAIWARVAAAYGRCASFS